MPQNPPSFIPDPDTPPSFVPDPEPIPQELMKQVQTPIEQPVDNRSTIRKGWDSLNAPLVTFPGREQMIEGMGGRETWPGYLTDQGLGLVEGATSPIGAATGGLLGLEYGLPKAGINVGQNLLRRANQGVGLANVGAGAEDIYQGNIGRGITEIGLGGLGLKGGGKIKNVEGREIPILDQSINTPPKMRMRANIDGSFTNLDTGEVIPANTLKPNAPVNMNLQNPIKSKRSPEQIKEIIPGEAEVTPEGTKISTTIVDKRGSIAQEILNFPRAIQSSWDASFPFRQGLGAIHKKAWWTSWDDMIKAYGSEEAFRLGQEAIHNRPLFKNVISSEGKLVEPSFANRAGLQLTDLTSDLTNREEQIMSTWAEKIPGVKRSNRAYTAFGNQLRADLFEELIGKAEKLGLDPKKDMALAKNIAGFVNSASGRGSLGDLEQYAKGMNTLFFSPRLMSSRMQMIKDGLDPRRYYNSTMGNDPAAKMMARESLKSVGALVGTWTLIAGAAKLGGAEVSLDPSSADFGKIKVGDTRLDPAGGLQQYLVAIARQTMGGTTSSVKEGAKFKEFGSGFGVPTRWDAAMDFGANKLSPYFQFARSLMDASKQYPTPILDKTVRMVTPMLAQDIIDMMQEDPGMLPFAIPAAAVGFGTQTYGDKTKQERTAPGMFGKSDINFKGGAF